jgi:hypothetical protein
MNRVYVVMLFLIELMAFGANLYHAISAHESTLNVSYNEKPFFYNNSGKALECFTDVAHCTYEHPILFWLIIIHLVFIAITIISYVVIFITIHPTRQKWSPNCIRITYFGLAKAGVMLMLSFNSILLFAIFYVDHYFIRECSKLSFIIRLENMLTYLVLNCVEAVYIIHDLLSTSYKILEPSTESPHEGTALVHRNQSITTAGNT